MLAYELLAHLRNLILVGQEDGALMWMGTNAEWYEVEKEITENV